MGWIQACWNGYSMLCRSRLSNDCGYTFTSAAKIFSMAAIGISRLDPETLEAQAAVKLSITWCSTNRPSSSAMRAIWGEESLTILLRSFNDSPSRMAPVGLALLLCNSQSFHLRMAARCNICRPWLPISLISSGNRRYTISTIAGGQEWFNNAVCSNLNRLSWSDLEALRRDTAFVQNSAAAASSLVHSRLSSRVRILFRSEDALSDHPTLHIDVSVISGGI
mmetsp:Transcript_692/g.960  ORF Transcript_692/g.960 Transcript_692/m.960 type:complete len:222 (-) Transcript_692:836-1501(-)